MCLTGQNKSQFNVLWTSCIIHPDLLPTLTLCSTGSFPKKQDVKPSAAIFLTQFQHLCEEDGDNAISSTSLILAISTQTWILSSAAGYCGVNHTSVTNHFSCSQSVLPIPPNFPFFFHHSFPSSCFLLGSTSCSQGCAVGGHLVLLQLEGKSAQRFQTPCCFVIK